MPQEIPKNSSDVSASSLNVSASISPNLDSRLPAIVKKNLSRDQSIANRKRSKAAKKRHGKAIGKAIGKTPLSPPMGENICVDPPPTSLTSPNFPVASFKQSRKKVDDTERSGSMPSREEVLEVAQDFNDISFEFFGEDLPEFAEYFFQSHLTIKSPEYHGDILRGLQDMSLGANGREKNIVIVEPREFGKSTKAMMYVMWALIHKKKKFIIYISKSFDHAVKLIGPIKREFETNEEILQTYGDMRAEKWTESEMELKNGSKLLAIGRGQSVRGLKFINHRPDLVILDDIEDDESVLNKELRLKLREWLDKQVTPGVDSRGGNIAVFGTILHPDSLLANISKSELRDEKYSTFRRMFYAALDENDKSIWEGKFSTSFLLAERERDYYTFAQERMNQPIPVGAGMFKREYFHYFRVMEESIFTNDREIRLRDCNFYLTCDIALTAKEYSDYTVIMVTAVSPQNEIFVMEYTRERWEDPDHIINEIFRLNAKYPTIEMNGVEETAAQRWLIVNLNKAMRERNTFLRVRALKADKEKGRRISQLQPRFASGSVFIRPYMKELEDELLLFPKSPHDDVSDALAYLLQICRPGEPEEDSPTKSLRLPYQFSVDGEKVIEQLRNRTKSKGIFKEYQTTEDYDPYESDSFEEAVIKKWEEDF